MIEQVGFDHKRAVCLREIQKDLKHSAKLLLEDRISFFKLGKYFRVMETTIESTNGGLIIFQGMQNHTAESIKSLEGFDIVWGEEAQSLSQRSMDLLRPTIRKDGSELWFSWNTKQPSDPVDHFFFGNDPKKPGWQPYDGAVVVETNYWDNPWFPPVLQTEMEYDKRRDPDKYANIWCGKYEKYSGARVFTNWRVEEFETPADARFYFGGDWGFSVDPTVLIRCFITGRLLFVDYEAYRVGCEIDHTPALFRTVPGADKWPIRADNARPETISYMKRNGFPNVVPSTKGPGSVEDGIEFLKSFDIVVHPRCKHTIDELSFYSWKTDPKTQEVLPILEDKNNHVIDALRYAVEGNRTGGTLIVPPGMLQRFAARTGRTPLVTPRYRSLR